MWKRTYFIVKNDAFIDDRVRSWELIFLFSFISLYLFEKRPSIARVWLADTTSETSKSQRTISHAAKVVRVTVQTIGMNRGNETVDLVTVQRRTAGTCGVDVPVIEGRPSFNTATKRSAEVASPFWSWIHLQDTWKIRLTTVLLINHKNTVQEHSSSTKALYKQETRTISHSELIKCWMVTSLLTRIWTREQPLSCSGTPEGVRCLCLCFFLSPFVLPLRFCFLLVFLRGAASVDAFLGSWTEAVVGHATLLCSEERLRPTCDIKSKFYMRQSVFV